MLRLHKAFDLAGHRTWIEVMHHEQPDSLIDKLLVQLGNQRILLGLIDFVAEAIA